MCGRYVIESDATELAARYRLQRLPEEWFPADWPTYNAAPSQILPVIIEPTEGERELVAMQWGLIPRWQRKDGKGLAPINARSETIAEKPMFRNLTTSKRCIVPINGFYEWRKTDGRKQPYYLAAEDGEIWSIAGLYDTTHDEDKDVFGSFTILTTSANPRVSMVHDRMPVILPRDDEAAWLSPDVTDQNEIMSLLRPYAEEAMTIYPVSPLVNSPRNNSPELIEPEGEGENRE